MRDSAIIYRSFFEAIKSLPKENQAEVWEAICEFAFNFKEINLTGVSAAFFTLIKPNLEANIKKWKNGNEPKEKQTVSKRKAKRKQDGSKPLANVDVNDNVDKDNNLDVNKNNLPFSSENFESVWNTWIKYRKESKVKAYTETSLKAALESLQKKSGNNESVAIEIINQSIIQNWQGLFELKTKPVPQSKDNFEKRFGAL